ncbi:putative secondary metabolism biosynthetic enzyme [Claviceps purpurea]|nr:putative secondary metabolism biosynthetic enzyme [Claviceps purpurea]
MTSKVFAITGGASGIGAATCRLLAERGAAVICLADVSSTNFTSLQESIAKSNPSTLVHCTELDGAGLRATPTILEENDAEWSRILDVNLNGVFYSTRAQVRVMKDLPPGHRSIVNVASIAAFSHVPDVYAYGTSKSACAYLTTCIAADVFWSGIRVNCVSPGITNTPMLPQFEPKAKSLDEIKDMYRGQGYPTGEADGVARTIVWLLSEDSIPVHGANINVGACPP